MEGEENTAPNPEGGEPQVQDTPSVEKKLDLSKRVPLVVLILVALGILFFVFQGNLGSNNAFGVPMFGNHIVLYDESKFYSFNAENGDLEELGIFLAETAHEVAISSDLSNVALAVPRARGGSEILMFTSYENEEFVISRSNRVNDLAVSNNNIVIFGEGSLDLNKDRNLFSVLPVVDDTARTLGKGNSPFFLDGGNYAALGTSFGFKLLDFVNGDTLDTETPDIAVAEAHSVSRNGKYMSVTDAEGVTVVYSISSVRPIDFSREFILPLLGTHDAVVSSRGNVAVLVEEDGTVFISVYEDSERSLVTYPLLLSSDAELVSWNK